jgi:acetyltransferase
MVCGSHETARSAFEKLAKPCVVKILSPSITHKTEIGGVMLNVQTKEDLAAALQRIDDIDAPGPKSYLVEEMVAPGLEIIIGGKSDKSFGPVVLLGLGGTAAEAMEDVTMRLAPLTWEDALEMISELKAAALFDGWRGGAYYDKDAVADALVKVSELMLQHPEIGEMDINPVRVFPKGLVVLDALIVC